MSNGIVLQKLSEKVQDLKWGFSMRSFNSLHACEGFLLFPPQSQYIGLRLFGDSKFQPVPSHVRQRNLLTEILYI